MGAPQQDPRGGYDLGSYMPTGVPGPAGMPHHDPLQQQPEWGGAHAEGGAPRDAYGGGQMGYEPTHGGALEQTYAQDEAGDYDVDEPRRGSWVLRIAGAIVVAIGLGYGLAQGYKLVADSSPSGATPVVHSDSEPAKITPADPGGKQFAHTDSKIMGRLGEGSPVARPPQRPTRMPTAPARFRRWSSVVMDRSRRHRHRARPQGTRLLPRARSPYPA